MQKLLLSVFFIISLSSCSSMKPNYNFCKETDWRELGMKDALADKKQQESFHKYKKMCSGFDEKEMKPSLTMYRFGHTTGVKNLCTYTKGREFGMAQKTTANNCSTSKHKEFYKGIKDGVNEFCEYDAGYNQALKGLVTSKVCLKGTHKNFYKGVAAGIKTYCTYQYGVNIGKNDMSYTGICKGEAEQEFMRGFTVGQNQSEIIKLRNKSQELELENARLKERLSNLEEDNNRQQSLINKLRRENVQLEEQVKSLKRGSGELY